MKSLILASIAATGLTTAPVAEPPANEHFRLVQAMCDDQLAVRQMTVVVSKPGIYTIRWDNIDLCTKEK